MIVIATGPRSNGTSILYRILCTGVQLPLHIPAFPPWVRGRDWSQDFPNALFVIIRRDYRYATKSAFARGLNETEDAALAEQREARAYLTGLVGRLGPRALVVTYEGLVGDTARTLGTINAFLASRGHQTPLTLPEPIEDADAKWR